MIENGNNIHASDKKIQKNSKNKWEDTHNLAMGLHRFIRDSLPGHGSLWKKNHSQRPTT
jgi:hypothetical protein